MGRKKQLTKETTELSQVDVEKGKLRQEIANLCTTIGDRSFVIRQANSDITSLYVQIDKLRGDLLALDKQVPNV